MSHVLHVFYTLYLKKERKAKHKDRIEIPKHISIKKQPITETIKRRLQPSQGVFTSKSTK